MVPSGDTYRVARRLAGVAVLPLVLLAVGVAPAAAAPVILRSVAPVATTSLPGVTSTPGASLASAPIRRPSSSGQVSETLLARSIAFRREFGLDSNPALIRSLIADRALVARDERTFGVPLTPQEDRALRTRQHEDRAVPGLASYAESRFPSSYAGLYIDQAHGGVVYIGFAGKAARRVRVLARHFRYPQLLRPVTMTNSYKALTAISARVVGDKKALAAAGITVVMSGVDVRHNVVLIGAQHLTPAISRALRVRFGPAIKVVQAKASTADRYSDYPPMTGGLDIFRLVPAQNEEVDCTSGFIGFAGPEQYVLTAGHCGADGTNWFHSTVPLGQMQSNSFYSGTDADAGAILLNVLVSSSYQVYISEGDYRSMVGTETVVPGTFSCMSAVTSGYQCGVVTFIGESYSPDGITVNDTFWTSYPTNYGDSGGPVLDGGYAQGIISGFVEYEDNGTVYLNGVASPIGNVEAATGVTVG